MRYSVEQCPNPDVVVIHTDFKIPRFFCACGELWNSERDRLDDEDQNFILAILDVPGVVNAYGGQYHVQIEKAKLFTWDAIVPEAVEAIRKRFAPNGKLVKA